jgi:hypothetical protein
VERQRYYNHTCQCEWCERIFQASRYDAKFCSDACRKQASREPERLLKAELRAQNAMISFLRMHKTNEGYQAAIDRLQSIIDANSLLKK